MLSTIPQVSLSAMATQDQPLTLMELPSVPVSHDDWIAHAAAHPKAPMCDLVEPYKAYDSKLREIFAQQPDHTAIGTPNVV